MASGDFVAMLPIQQASSPGGGGLPSNSPGAMRSASLAKPHIRGLHYPFGRDTIHEWHVPVQLLGAAAGITIKVPLVSDPRDPATGGVAARFSAVVKKLAANETVEDAGFGTEVAASVTMDATPGEIAVASIALSNAQADAIAKGDLVAVQIKRLAASDALDVYRGAILALPPYIVET